MTRMSDSTIRYFERHYFHINNASSNKQASWTADMSVANGSFPFLHASRFDSSAVKETEVRASLGSIDFSFSSCCLCVIVGGRESVKRFCSFLLFFFFCFPFINWWENKGSVLHCLQRQWTCLLCASRAIKKKFVLMVHVFAFHRAANNSRDEVYTKHAAQKQALLQRGAVGSTLSTHRPIYEERSMHLRTFHCTFGERASIFGILTNEGTPASVIPLCRYHPSATCGGH